MGGVFAGANGGVNTGSFAGANTGSYRPSMGSFLKSGFSTDQGIDEMLFAACAPRGYCGLRKRGKTGA
jgi:hypothetical protein